MGVKQQKGVILVFLVIIIAVLLGIAAFSLDLGRLLVLKTEMQNAVDEAALAGAKELDASSGAVKRAKAAALGLIESTAHFTRDTSDDKRLLSPELGENDVQFRFYCAIENDMDATGKSKADCGSYLPEDGKVEIPEEGDDADTYVHYIEVTLNPNRLAEEVPRYSIPLFFLPALRVLGLDDPAPILASTSTRALAGRQFLPCRYPPIMICDPSEDPSLPQLTKGNEGIMVVLKALTGSSATWAPGNFGFLVPAACMEEKCSGNKLRDELEKQLADESGMDCQPPIVSTYPGANTDFAVEPMNSRFGIGNYNASPAPNVIDYPRDDLFVAERFGNGVMVDPPYSADDPKPTTTDQLKQLSESQYIHYYFSSPLSSSMAAPIRYNHYLKELETGILPSYSVSGIDDCQDVQGNVNKLKDCRNLRGQPDKTSGPASRRVIYVASMKCLEQGIKGNMDNIPVPTTPAGWKKFFLTEHVAPPSANPDGKVTYYAEYLGDASEADGNFEVVVQLYE